MSAALIRRATRPEVGLSTLLPLFPLDIVLFPGVSLPLHIFEPRYKEMTAECLEQKKPFGVIRAKEDGLAEIGCTAEILNVSKQYPDGRMDIVTQGGKRFEVMEVNQERNFLQAEVLYLHDDPGEASAEDVARVSKLHAEIMDLAGEPAGAAKKPEERPLSYSLAGSLPLDLDFKQTLLGMKSEAERIRAVAAYFETILPTLRRTLHVRRKASGNGAG
jgi:Lon protease-like protein